MLTLAHALHDGLTLLHYNHTTGHVEVKLTGTNGNMAPFTSSMPLAMFLRELGIPFRAVRDAARIERGLWRADPCDAPAVV